MAVYYHCTPLKLGEGSVVMPGNWGRIIGLYGLGDRENAFRVTRELAYEYGRRAFNPDAPSRLNCTFACPTLEDAIAFRSANQAWSLINEVEPVDSEAPAYVADWRKFDTPHAGLADQDLLIQRYWQDTPDTHREVLLGGALRILGTVQI